MSYTLKEIEAFCEGYCGTRKNPDYPACVEGEINKRFAELKSENARLLAANRDIQLHWDVLKADYDRLTAQVAAADGLREVLEKLNSSVEMNSIGDNHRVLRAHYDEQLEALNHLYSEECLLSRKAITAYDKARSQQND